MTKKVTKKKFFLFFLVESVFSFFFFLIAWSKACFLVFLLVFFYKFPPQIQTTRACRHVSFSVVMKSKQALLGFSLNCNFFLGNYNRPTYRPPNQKQAINEPDGSRKYSSNKICMYMYDIQKAPLLTGVRRVFLHIACFKHLQMQIMYMT